MTGPKSRARRGVGKTDITEAAFELFASVGESAFSIRKVAGLVGVDPMTILHHFGSKDELLRAIADHGLRSVQMPSASQNWRQDLKAVGSAYRMLAQRIGIFTALPIAALDHLTLQAKLRAIGRMDEMPAAARAVS